MLMKVLPIRISNNSTNASPEDGGFGGHEVLVVVVRRDADRQNFHER
jgi:hypothetical protein